jgi:hypothetical protein
MKWVEAMTTFENNGKTTGLFLFNHVIAHFGVPQAIVTDHGPNLLKSWVFAMITQCPIIHKPMDKSK